MTDMVFTVDSQLAGAVIGCYQGLTGYVIEIPITCDETFVTGARWTGEPEAEAPSSPSSAAEWLESPEGEQWSRGKHFFSSWATIAWFKNDSSSAFPMRWTPASVIESFDDDDRGDFYVEEPAIPDDYEIPSCPA